MSLFLESSNFLFNGLQKEDLQKVSGSVKIDFVDKKIMVDRMDDLLFKYV